MYSKYAKYPLMPSWWKIGLAVIIFTVLILHVHPVSGKKSKSHHHRPKVTLNTNIEWVRKRPKSSECRLGRLRYPLNATWSPDLGPPFGVWKCVTCICTPVQRKRRIIARVICRNIKNECPKTTCSNAFIPPDSCCKICPGIKGPPPGFVMEDSSASDGLSDSKDFAVLLNGRTTQSPLTTSNLATGRIFLRRGTLHYSFVFSGSTAIPSTVQFMNGKGDILEELEPQPTPYEVNNGRLCGTWTRVPRQYRDLLLSEKLWVALVPPDEEDIISGRISRYAGVNTEVFSALLSPPPGNETLPGGGTAIISVAATTDSLHVSLIFNGIFKSNEIGNVSVLVRLTPTRNLPAVTDTIVLQKVYSDINVAEIKTTLGEKSLRLLTRGKVYMSIMSEEMPQLRLEGAIISRATCNVYHSVLTSEPRFESSSMPPLPSYGAGWGLLFVINDGDFKYQMKLEGLTHPVEKVTLQLKHRKKVKILEDITTSYSDGWINGTYGNPTFRDLDTLFRGRLQIVVAMSEGFVIRGLFEAVSVTEALRSLHPSLLKSPSSWMAASTWVSVDDDCVMHYDTYLAGRDPLGAGDPTWSLQLRDNDTLWDPRLDFVNVTLEHIITGREIAAHTTTLTRVSLSRLNAGATFLDLTILNSAKPFQRLMTLTGNLKDVSVPQACLLFPNGQKVKRFKKKKKNNKKKIDITIHTGSDHHCKGFICLDEEVKPFISKKCIDDDKRVYEDGSTWQSPVNHCARCMCTLGVIKCQDEPCHKPSCADATTRPGQCCPSCPAVSGLMSERVCKMADDNLRNIGSFWHPFLAPKGFDTCVTCYCNVTSTGEPVIRCDRVSCPPLNCLDSEANFKDDSCCHKCPTTTPIPTRRSNAKGFLSEDRPPKVSEEDRKKFILKHGGCLERKKIARPNGCTWYTFLFLNGVTRCVSCTCKDGRMTCSPDQCPVIPKCRKGEKCRKRKGNYRLKSKKSRVFKRKNRRKEKRKFFGCQR